MGFKDMMKIAKENAKRIKEEDIQKRAELIKQGVPFCPKCLSTNLTANKKGYGLGKGVIGAVALGPLGLVAGGLGKNKVECTCLNCGYKFKAGSKI